eukprot:gene8419-1733_t
MKQIIMVAEKPSLAASLAKLLSNGHAVEHSVRPTAVHEYVGKFQGHDAKFKFTSVTGHVLSLDFKAEYNNWDAVKPVELFKAGVEKKENSRGMCRHLREVARGCDCVVLWLDCDREGENICFEVLDEVKPALNNKGRGGNTVFRAFFSAITEKDVKKAMQTLGDPNYNESLSVDARQELDLRLGGKYGDLDSSLISYGPCQTPTLGFCVERHDQIQGFQPEPYWVIEVAVRKGLSAAIRLDWERVRLFDQEVTTMLHSTIADVAEAEVLSVEQKEKTRGRPAAMNTVELMRNCSAGLGMGTETTAYPENFDFREVLRAQERSANWGAEARELLEEGMVRPKRGEDKGDHPPITPMRLAGVSDLGGDEWRVYDLVARHFIATLSPDLKYLQTTITWKVGAERFHSAGKIVTDKGFTKVMHWLAPTADEAAPSVTVGERIPIETCKVVAKQTSPPGYLTESELITLMEKHAIGTDASIPVHINNICERNFVKVGGGRTLIPTSLGVVLVHGYLKIDPELVLPTMRATVEKQLDLIALGKADFHDVLHRAIVAFEEKFKFFEARISSMDELFEVSFSPLSATGKPMSKCAKCLRYMKYIAQQLKCPLDGFELLLWSSGSRGQSYPLCPYCYNNPPFEGSRKGEGCNQCPHPTCTHSIVTHGVCPCVECETGVLVLDPNSAPNWKIACNKCNVTIKAFQNAHKVVATKDVCNCGAKLLRVDFNKKDAAALTLPGGTTVHTGCMFCNPTLSSLVELHHAQMRHPMHKRGRGGRGRGGRGRGRGGRKSGAKGKWAELENYFV